MVQDTVLICEMEDTLRDKKEGMNRRKPVYNRTQYVLKLMEPDCMYLKYSDKMMTIISKGSEIGHRL